MNSIESFLDISFDATEYSSRIVGFNALRYEKELEKNIEELDFINKKLGEANYKFDDNLLCKKVLLKFFGWAKQGFSKDMGPAFNKREAKALAYSMDMSVGSDKDIISSDTLVYRALAILEENWRSSYLMGIALCCFKNWGNSKFEGLDKLRISLGKKLDEYVGSRNTLISLKKNLRYISSSNGNIILGSDLALKRLSPTSVCDYLGVPQSWIGYEYFAKFIDAYFEKIKDSLNENYPGIERFLTLHNNPTTTLCILSKVIIKADAAEMSGIQDGVQRFSIANIGDPVKSQAWNNTEGLSASEVQGVQSAKIILNKWITRRFINVFFDTCLNDPRRRSFWLRYADRVETFRVFGPLSVKTELQKDKRISEFVPSRYQTTYSKNGISAIVMVVNDYKLIEFSDPGYAFYAYRKTSPHSPDLENTQYSSVNSFRNGNMPFLVYRIGYQISSFSPEGRLSHNDGDFTWEQVFKIWIDKYV